MSWLTDLTSEQKQRSAESFRKLKAWTAIACVLTGTAPSYALGFGAGQQQQQTPPAQQADMPTAPQPHFTQPLYLHPSEQNFAKGRGYFPNPIAPYLPINLAPGQNVLNALSLGKLMRNGKIYLSLSNAILLALENNYDIAIQRVNLNIADTDILRSRAGANLFGVNSGLVTGTLGGSTASVNSVGGGPGGTTSGSGGAGAGFSGLTLTTNGGGPAPVRLDPTLQAQIELDRVKTPSQNVLFSGGLPATDTNTNQYNFTYNQGFITGTNLQVDFNNSRVTTNNPFSAYSPTLSADFSARITQNLLQGFGPGINGRFIIQAKNDRRIADSAFRAQLLYTINQVENIYWGLVSAYEEVAAKQRAAQQSANLVKDDEKQLQVGAIAPLDLVNVKSQHAADQQALIAAQSTLEYQQLLMEQAISRSLDNPAITNAPVVPTDRVSLAETPEELKSVDQLVREADENSPSIEQAALALKNDRITLRAERNGLLPKVQAYAFYGGQGIGGAVSPYCNGGIFGANICNQLPSRGYGTVFSDLFNSTGPNKGAGVNIIIPIRNRTAQSEQARSRLEYEQGQMRIRQLYVQIRMQVINGQYALTDDRAAVQAALANRNYNQQSLDAEIKKLHLGAATTADVLQQERNLATAEASLISATAKYATDRAALNELLGNTLDRYGISIVNAATGQIRTPPTIPGIEPASTVPVVNLPAQQQRLREQQKQPVPQPEKPAPDGMPQHQKASR